MVEVAETITVTGDAPVVDGRTTALVNDFGVAELQEVPSATDVWAVLGQTAGVRMRGFDVGGSHKSQQTSYESFGVRDQNRVLADGVDTTEGEGATGFYFDYYSIGEFTTTAAGNDVEMTAPGSLVMMTMKSGGNELSGLVHGDYEHARFVGDNTDADLGARGYTGNQNLLFFETHADLGGPIVRDRAWFYGFYNHFRIDKAVSGVDRRVATDLGDFDSFGGKATLRLTARDRLIGYTNWGLKEKPKRGLSTDVGPDSVLAHGHGDGPPQRRGVVSRCQRVTAVHVRPMEAAGHGQTEPLRARPGRQPRRQGGVRVPDRQQPEQGATGAVPGAEGTPVDPGLPPEYVDELNLSLEHEVASDTSLRFSYVRKDLSGDTPPPRARAAR